MAKKRYPRSEVLVAQSVNGPSYIMASDPASQKDAFIALGEAIQNTSGISHTVGSYGGQRDFSNLAPHVSGRPGLTRRGYDYFRPDESVANQHREIIRQVNIAYDNNGLIRNVIDLMADFACQGIRLSHPNKRIQRFFRNWFKIVNGKERSERFLNYLYRNGNVVLRKQTAKISAGVEEQMYKTHASADLNLTNIGDKVPKNEIPWRYTFLHPGTIQVVGGSLSSFTGDKRYTLCLPDHLARIIKSPKTDEEREMVSKLPADIRNAANSRKPYPLPKDKTLVFHYKKDDWQEWAKPMIYSIMSNVITLEKLELADNAALDGAISSVRIFTLGDIAAGIFPTKNALLALSEILQNHPGAGTMDLVWGPDLKMQESKSEVYKFLGEEKYKATLNAIYAGLGIPPTLTGTFGAAGTTNNFVSLKTLTERLQYGREVLKSFWEKEIIQVQKAMGFRFPATIEYDIMTLGDEVGMKNLYISLADRQIISDEVVQNMFGQDPEIERIRLNREAKDRTNGRMVEKAGPFHDPQVGDGLKKLALQTGLVAPSEVGIDLKPRKPGEKSGMDFKQEQLKQAKKGMLGQGRPKGKKDSTKRKTKTFTPKSKAMELWAKNAQDEISELLNPGILSTFGKKNMRALTAEEAEKSEKLKFGVLSNMPPMCKVADNLAAAVDKSADMKMMALANHYIKVATEDLGRRLTLDELKNIQATAYVIIKEL